mmetsp:Transcript_65864/g.157417  ORF Transcript_65864/g.157417 Transcript_65864/m.157417 type:complete len:231 (-) Transcript_65864:4131-4823(-)
MWKRFGSLPKSSRQSLTTGLEAAWRTKSRSTRRPFDSSSQLQLLVATERHSKLHWKPLVSLVCKRSVRKLELCCKSFPRWHLGRPRRIPSKLHRPQGKRPSLLVMSPRKLHHLEACSRRDTFGSQRPRALRIAAAYLVGQASDTAPMRMTLTSSRERGASGGDTATSCTTAFRQARLPRRAAGTPARPPTSAAPPNKLMAMRGQLRKDVPRRVTLLTGSRPRVLRACCGK